MLFPTHKKEEVERREREEENEQKIISRLGSYGSIKMQMSRVWGK